METSYFLYGKIDIGSDIMKIGLVVAEMKTNDLLFADIQLEKYIIYGIENNIDLLCFGEAYYQGFYYIKGDYKRDLENSLTMDNMKDIIVKIYNKLVKRGFNINEMPDISIGYIEKNIEGDNCIYSSNIIVNTEGDIIYNFRRISPGWKEKHYWDDFRYREGDKIERFNYKEKNLSLALCGDLWYDDEKLIEYENLEIDALLWPVYVDFSVEKWKTMKYEYAERVKNIKVPILFINSYLDMENKARGGALVIKDGDILEELEMEDIGVLLYEI